MNDNSAVTTASNMIDRASQRSDAAKARFSKERDSAKALTERQKCLVKLAAAGDIPAEVLKSKDNKTVVPPLAGALLKNEQDVQLFERLVFMARAGR